VTNQEFILSAGTHVDPQYGDSVLVDNAAALVVEPMKRLEFLRVTFKTNLFSP
jgi:hypothetical protein